MFFWISLLALAISFMSVKPLLNFLSSSGFTAKNYAGNDVPVGTGLLWGWVLLVCTALIGLVGTLVADVSAFMSELHVLAALVAGVTLLGFIDDSSRDINEKGFRAHVKAFLNGKLTSGLLKAAGGLVMSVIIAAHFTNSPLIIVLNALIIGLFMNFINLLDLRPGRALATFMVLTNIIMIATFVNNGMLDISWNFWGIFLAPATAIFLSDMRGQSMLGDTGSNTLGAILGYVTIVNFDTNIKVAVLFALLAFNIIADRISITGALEKRKKLVT